MNRTTRWHASLVALLASIGCAVVHANMPVPPRRDRSDAFVPRPEVAKLSALGFHTALADYYWLQAVQVVGRTLHTERYGTLLGRYIDVITTIDPWVDHPYRFAAVWLTGSEANVRQANELLRRSLPYHPDEWRNRFYLGFNHFYYLEEPGEASTWIEEAALLEGSPAYLGALAARLRAQEAGLDVAQALLLEMRRSSDDPDRHARYESALEAIRAERVARLLDAARERYLERTGRDIEGLADLVRGSDPVLAALPPEPNGGTWVLDEESREIVSSHVGSRYRPFNDPEERARRDGWRVERRMSDAEEERSH